MADAFTAGGAVAEPTEYVPLTMDRYITGLATQRSALRDADVSYLYSKFYSASRFDSYIDGLNMEVSAKLTAIRRPGLSVYNSQSFPSINRWYAFRVQIDGATVIKVMADCGATVYDATGPATKVAVWNKSAGAGKTSFQSVGNTLYFANGIDNKKWTLSTLSYKTSTSYTPLQFVIDGNNNIQVAEGGISLPLIGVSSTGNVTTLLIDPSSPNLPLNLNALTGIKVTFAGLTVATYLNGVTLPIVGVPTETSISVSFAHADYSLDPETGTTSTGNGVTGAAAPAFSSTIGGITQDGGQQWICKGSSVQNWGIATPLTAPTRVQTALPQTFPAWSKNTYFSTCFLITDPAGFIQLITGFGTTGATVPTFSDVTGVTTMDGTVTWTCQGPGTYSSSTAYALNAYMTTTDALGNPYFFKAIVPGVTGASRPNFPPSLGTPVVDGTVVWENIGVGQTWNNLTAAAITGNFAIIPVQGGGNVIVGTGQSQGNGTSIALPTGYSTSNMISWSSPATGFSGSSVVTEGVFQSTSTGGFLNSEFQGNFGGAAFPATSNWAAAAWSADATVTTSTIGSIEYLTFTTLNGDTLCICAGSILNAATITVPATFSGTQFLSICGPAGSDNPGHIMQGVSHCTLDTAPTFSLLYDDNDGSQWSGPGNVFGIFWKTGGGVTSQPVTGGTSILIPTTPGVSIALVQANAGNGTTFGIPGTFSGATVIATAAMAGWTPSGSNHGHGYSCTVSNFTVAAFYTDGGANTWNGTANIFALAALPTTTVVSPMQSIIDVNGFQQTIIQSGVTGASAPLWATTQGTTTGDNFAVWENAGAFTVAGTAPQQWAFSYKNFTMGTVSTASPLSAAMTINAGNFPLLTGTGSPDTQADTIIIWATAQGGGILLFADEIPAPAPGQSWTYAYRIPDSQLNVLIEAPINHVNDPPPLGLAALSYHLGRVWGFVNHIVQFCTGPDVTVGAGNEAWSPSNVFAMPDAGARLVPVTLTNGGLLCFTASDIYCIFGTGTSTNPFYDTLYAQGIGLLNYDALDVIGATIHLFTTANKQISLDPSAGYTETGFPIGDQFLKVTTGGISEKLYSPTTAFVSWHEQSSGDTGLFVADGAVGWFRYSPISAPESGFLWSLRAQIEGGTSAVQSIETTPGFKNLLVGPKANGPILVRDFTVNSDNGVPYSDTYGDIGSIQLCQPSQVAEVAAIILDSTRVGTAPTCGVLFGEIRETINVPFDMLEKTSNDPPNLPASETLFNDRFALMQNGICPQCRHMQLRIQFAVEDQPSELLTHTIYGAKHNERIQQ